jgi:hypothetical protein
MMMDVGLHHGLEDFMEVFHQSIVLWVVWRGKAFVNPKFLK